jgi:hypothetical protein
MVIVWICVGVALIALLLHLTSDKYKVRKALEEAKSVRIESLTSGTVAKVIGTVRTHSGEVLTAPLSGRTCVFYEVVVEESVPDPGSSSSTSSWRQRIREVQQVDFDVEDGTGTVHVRTDEMKHVATTDSHHSSGFLNDATPQLEAFLQRHGTASEGFVFNRTMRYMESVFEVGERVAVLGEVVEDGSPERLCLQAPAGGHLIVSDEYRSVSDHG